MNREIRTTSDSARGDYYWANGQRVELVPELRVFSLKMAPGRSSLSPEALDILRQRVDPVLFIDQKGIKVYETDTETTQRALRILNEEEAVSFATPAFRRSPSSDELMFVTNEFLVQFKLDVTRQQIDEINARHGTWIVEELGYAPNAFKLGVQPSRSGTSAIEMANLYYEQEPTEWAHPVTVKRLATRQQIRNPSSVEHAEERAAQLRDYLSEQWHLENAHTKVIDSWNLAGAPNNGRGSSTIKVAVLDNGVDVDHVEFVSKIAAQFDFNTNTADARPKRVSDMHGTACAGVAVSSGVKAFGAAPNCQLIPGRMPMFTGPDDEARMFQWTADQGADVISCSWGPPDNTGTVEPLPDSVAAAIRYCVTRGRGGKGIPIFFAAGNGNELVSTDGYASCPDVMAVAACTSQHQKSPYSDFGPEIWVTASSNGSRMNGDRSIFTVDRRGVEGYNTGSSTLGDAAGDYVNTFGGTSSAAPLVAGIAALVLSANPDLQENPNTQRQVRQILAQTAEKISSGYDANGHSDFFGYGRVNALAAVKMALQMRGGGTTGTGTGTASRPSIQPVSSTVSSAGPAPEFLVDPRPHQFYVVEVATRPELFDFANHSTERNSSNFFGSWVSTPFPTASSFPVTYWLPDPAWNLLKNADRLYYRLWATDSSNNWVNEETTTDDSVASTAPSIAITRTSGTGTGTATGGGTVRFPSGAIFNAVPNPLDYSDPANGGVVPLIEVAGREEERLSTNFQVKELAARDGAPYARISVELVEGLQRLRNRVGSIMVISGYRHPALNASVGGADESRHMSGQAADIICSAVTPLRLSELALEEFGCDIGLGLGQNSIHVDVRGSLASWVYEGAEMTEVEFDTHVRGLCIGRLARTQPEERMDERATLDLPSITGPDAYNPAAPDPLSFMLEPGEGRWYQVEVATRPEFLTALEYSGDHSRPVSSETFFRSDLLGPLEAGIRSTAYILPDTAWELLRWAARLYYRLRTVDTQGEQLTMPDNQVGQAPWVDLHRGQALHTRMEERGTVVLSIEEARRRDEASWNDAME